MFRTAVKSLEKNRDRLLSLPNVVGVGIGYKTVAKQRTKDIAVIVFVERKAILRDLDRKHIIPHTIDSVVTDVVEIGRVQFLSNTDKVRPAQPGHSIGHYLVSAGTFGAIVLDSETKEELILSNNHVLANLTNGQDGRSKLGDPIIQPGIYDGGTEKDKIATLKRFVPLVKEEKVSCLWASRFGSIINKLCKLLRSEYEIRIVRKGKLNIVDCAVASPIKKEYISEKILKIGKVTGIDEAKPYQTVRKNGRSSGLTEGLVIAINVSLKVAITPGEEYLFGDQIVCDMKSLPGDSGSLVLDSANRAIGLLFAGSEEYTIVNRIQNILNLLKVEFGE